jgi:hypothetical protein
MGNVSHRSADLVPDCATKTATSDHSPFPLGSFVGSSGYCGKSSVMWNQGALYATKT